MGNPYLSAQAPGKGQGFVGQEALLSQCQRAIKRGTHLSVVGGPGSGKTLLLHQVRAQSIEAGINAAYLDCGSVESPKDFVQRLAQQLSAQANATAAGEQSPLPTDEGELFYFLEELGASVVLLLDNLCALPRQPGFALDFWRTLRGIATDPRLKISVITTSGQLLRDCFPADQSASDFWNIFAVHILTQTP